MPEYYLVDPIMKYENQQANVYLDVRIRERCLK